MSAVRDLHVIALMVVGLASEAGAQQKIIKLAAPINHPSINTSAPFVSLDGNSLLFVSDNAEDNVLTVFYSAKPDGVNWKDPVALPKNINSRANFLRGFALSPDGRQLLFSSQRGGGLGGYDIYISELRGAVWAEPVNFGQPVNSRENEACPSLSSDGLQVYFMRCEKMDPNKASGCKIWTSTRRTLTTPWTPPVELPPAINTGNSQAPRIMGDGETIIFSTDKLRGKGGMDVFFSRRENQAWSAPVALEFANTQNDDQFVSASSLGRYLMMESMGQMGSELVEVMFPPELKPKGVMKVEGHISGLPDLSSAYITLSDSRAQVKLQNTRPDKNGLFTLYVKEGMSYDVSVDPEQESYTFFIRTFDLSHDRINTFERMDVKLKQLAKEDEIELTGITFKPLSTELAESSKPTLRKLVRLIKGNPAFRFNVEVSLYGYKRDSVMSDPDLTEVQTDSLHYTVTKTLTDTLGNVTTSSTDSVVVKTTYHNDRTVQQALEVVNYLIEEGVPAGTVSPSSRVFDAIPEERKLLVKVTAH